MKWDLVMIKIPQNKLTNPINFTAGTKSMLEKHKAWFFSRILKKDPYDLNGLRISVSDVLFNLLKYSKTQISDIVTGNPDAIESMANIKGDFYKDFLRRKNKMYALIETQEKKRLNKQKLSKKQKENLETHISPLILYAFGYSDFNKGIAFGVPEWNAYVYMKKMNMDVCPYCNRQYIFTIGSNSDKEGRPDIDHFYPESDFPYLSCSLYNFIPSCHYCNHQKLDDYNGLKNGQLAILYPYKECFGEDAFFCIERKDPSKKVNYLKYEDVTVCLGYKKDISPLLRYKISVSNAAFHLLENYKLHEIELRDLLIRFRNYAMPKRMHILKMLKGVSTADLDKFLIFYNNLFQEQILGLPLDVGTCDYPLRKFKKDIIKQLMNVYKTIKPK